MSRVNMLAATVAAVALAGLAAGCVTEQEPHSYVQANVVDKAYFQGEWWYTNKIIDVSVETDEWGFPGEPAYNFSQPEILSMERIRWVIDENYLYAMRSYELVDGGNLDGDDPDYIGEPVIAYTIEKHFDIRRQYSSTTGEEYNVIEENTKDRRWYERRFMRVDWAQIPMAPTVTNINLYEAYMGGILTREQVPMFVQDGSHQDDDYPLSYQPQFHRASLEFDEIHSTHLCDDPATEGFREGDFDPGEMYYMSFVTREVISPGDVPDPYTGQPVNFCMSVYSNAPYCSSNFMFIRHSFLKISPHHDFAPTDYPDRTRQNHFGTFQTAQWIYDSVEGDDPTDPVYGDTWFWHRNAVLMKMWRNYHDADGNVLPKSQRDTQDLTYFTSKETPRWLIRPAYALFAEWNDVWAKTFRALYDDPAYPQPTRPYDNPRNWFEEPDPAFHDIECWIAKPDGSPADPDPLPQYDVFQNPTGEGITEEVSGMDAFMNENQLKFHGDECFLKVQVNSCDAPLDMFPLDVQDRIQDYMDRVGKDHIDQLTDDELFTLGVLCEERGDLRYHLLSYVDLPAPNVGWLGIATLQGDPITGELIHGDANIGAAALHGYRRRATEEYDLITGNVSELAFETGEDVRSYMDRLGYAMRPTRPARDIIEADLGGYYGVTQKGIADHMRHVMATKGQFLQGAEGYSQLLGPGRLASLKGSDIEYNLLDNDDALALAGFENQGMSPGPRPVDAILETVSPFRVDMDTMARRLGQNFKYQMQHNVIMPNSFIDYSVTKWAQDRAGMPRKNLVFEIEQKLYKDTLIHEMGHVVSQRHNFIGSNDPWNYPEPFHQIAQDNPLPAPIVGCDVDPPTPSPDDYDTNDDCALDAVEANAYETDYNRARHDRELESIDTWMTSSMMDYTANWYERYMPEGFLVMPYDRAAIMFAYGDQVEVYDNIDSLRPRCDDPGSGRELDCITPLNTGRQLWTYYGGGDPCSVDSDCPYSTDGAFAADLDERQVAAGLTQRCETHSVGTQMCTNFYEDFDRYYETAGPTPPYVVRRYLYCDDYNTPRNGGNDPRCDVFGEGTSFRENVENLREKYLRKYLFTYFRRYRSTFGYGNVMSGWYHYIFEPLSLLHNMIYRYNTEGESYINDTGPYGFYDQYMACVDLMNFWMEMIGIPDVGSYRYDPYYDEYQRFSAYSDVETADMWVKSGLGRYVYTSYQTGLNGIYRLEYIGTINDKIFAMQAMLGRGNFTFNYNIDEMYFVNFYDFFPDEIRYLLMGLVTEEPEFYAPRVASVDRDTRLPYLQYVDFYRGNCTVESPDGVVGYDTCRAEPHELYEGMTPLNDGKTFMMQNYGLIYGLAWMPTYFDTAPQEMLHFYKLGSLDDAEIPAGMVQGEDYEIYTSRTNHQSYMAFQIEDEPGKVGGSIAFEVVKKLKTYQDEYDAWKVCYDDGNPDTNCGFEDSTELEKRIRYHYYDIQSMQSLVTYALELQHMYGINSFMGYTPSM